MSISSQRAYALVVGVLALSVSVAAAAALWWPLASAVYLPQIADISSISVPTGESIAPVRLRIPAIGVDAPVQNVGTTPEGRMASPADFDAVGWYEEGAQPGMRGKAVLAGHVDNAAGRPAVFVRLTDVNPGDAIEVVGASGEVLTFIVSSLERYPYDDAPLARIFGPSENTELILITCDGTWQPFKRTYSDRLVVFAYLNNSGAE